MINSHDDIKEFVFKMKEKHGFLPKFCHNLDVKPNKVFYGGPFFDDNEIIASINALLFSKWGSAGEFCQQFERDFNKYTNSKFSVFVNSGSSANLLLIAACKEYFKWNNDSEIILSPCGFTTTLSSITFSGLKPVFIDIEFETLNFDISKIEEKITENTKAIFLSPVLGNPPDIDRLLGICEKYKLKLLLDNCDSLGTKWGGKFLNEYAEISSCSFYPAHEITTLEGGMVSSNNSELIEIARSFSNWGRDCFCQGVSNLLPNGCCGKRFSNWIPEQPELLLDHKYYFVRPGLNLKPLDIQGAIGVEQLKKIDHICKIRSFNCQKIQSLFSTFVDGVSFPAILTKTWWVPFGTPIICKNSKIKNRLVKYLEDNGIQTRNYFAGNLLLHPAYKFINDSWKNYPQSNRVLNEVFFVGAAPTILECHINHIESVLQKWKN